MGALTRGEGADLFDLDTGQWVGVTNLAGQDQRVPTWSDSTGTALVRPDGSEVQVFAADYDASSNPLIPRSLAANIGVGTDHVLWRFDSLTGVTVTASATASISQEVYGISMLKVVTAAGTQTEVEVPVVLTPPIGGDVVVQVYMQDVFSCANLRVMLGKSSYTGWADLNLTLTGGTPPFREKDGWQIYTLSAGSKANGGAGFDFATDTSDKMKIRVVPPAGKTGTFFVHSFRLRAKRAPRFVVGFDDGRNGIFVKKWSGTLGGVASTYSIRDILNYYNIKPTLFLVSGVINTPGHISWDQVRQLYAEGWDIQAQIGRNTRGDPPQGARVMGPYGYALRAVSSVDTTADTITCSAVHELITPAASDVTSSAIEFEGTNLPAPLSVGVRYFARPTSTTAFKLFLTEVDSISNINAIDLTTTGTVANFFWRHANSRPDHTGILEDLLDHMACIERQIGTRPQHVAPNQGAADKWVNLAYEHAGIKYVRSIADAVSHRYLTQLPSDDIGPCWPRPACMVVQTDNAALSEADVQTAVNNIINDGAIGWSFHHDLDTPTGTVLNYLCSYLATKRAAGEITLVQARDL